MSKKAEQRQTEEQRQEGPLVPDDERAASWEHEGERAAREEIVAQFEDLRRERDEYRDLLQRKQAEFENYRKRTAKEREALRMTAQADVIKRLLPSMDALEKGLESMPATDDDPLFQSYRQGYELLHREMRHVFQSLGIEVVPTSGRTFDPQLHEAVMREMTDERPEGEILEEFRKGYIWNDILLRPPQVKVATRPTGRSPHEMDLSGRDESNSGEKVDIKA